MSFSKAIASIGLIGQSGQRKMDLRVGRAALAQGRTMPFFRRFPS